MFLSLILVIIVTSCGVNYHINKAIKELSVDVLCENEMLTFSREIIEKFTEVVC